MPVWPVLCFWCSGLLLCWFGGWAKAHYQYPAFSDVVLRGALLCVKVSLVLTIALARRNLHVYWKAAGIVFFLVSIGVSGHFYIGSHVFTALVAKQ
jgi:hypothetical protein